MTPEQFDILLRRAARRGLRVVLHDDSSRRVTRSEGSLEIYRELPLLERFRVVLEALELHAPGSHSFSDSREPPPRPVVLRQGPETAMLAADVCQLCGGARYGVLMGLALCSYHVRKSVMRRLTPPEVLKLRSAYGAHPEVSFERYDDGGRLRQLIRGPSGSRLIVPTDPSEPLP